MKLKNNFKKRKYGLKVRLVNEEDAGFILKLRTNPMLSKYLHPISPNISKQKEWIKRYKIKEKDGLEYYFIFCKNGIKLGVERIYNLTNCSFTHGSLIFSPDAPIGSSILADIITREIGFFELNLSLNLFDVRKKNVTVINYHKKYDIQLISEDEDSYYFKLSKENFEKNKGKFLKLLNK